MGQNEQLLEAGKQQIQNDVNDDISRYIYKDISRVDREGRHKKWIRIPIVDLEINKQKMIKLESQHCYATIQSFNRLEPEENEPYISPLYFDLDSENFQETLDDCRKLQHYFAEGCYINEGVEFFFSGNRGFHITVDYNLFYLKPFFNVSKVIRFMAEQMVVKLDLKTFDRSVYTKRRMWRMANTLHGKSGLYKIQLYPTELGTLSAQDIKDLAVSPRDFEE